MKKLIALFAVVITTIVLLTSCGPSTTGPIASKPTLQQEATGIEVMRFVKYTNQVDAYEFVTADSKYTLVDEAWFKANVLNGFNDFLVKNGVGAVNLKKNDCDDFSRAFSFFSRVKSMQASFMDSDLAVGDLYYKNFDVSHAINVAVVLDTDKKWKILFIEPQGPKVVDLQEEYRKFYVFHVGM
jgi:hypothetical protein